MRSARSSGARGGGGETLVASPGSDRLSSSVEQQRRGERMDGLSSFPPSYGSRTNDDAKKQHTWADQGVTAGRLTDCHRRSPCVAHVAAWLPSHNVPVLLPSSPPLACEPRRERPAHVSRPSLGNLLGTDKDGRAREPGKASLRAIRPPCPSRGRKILSAQLACSSPDQVFVSRRPPPTPATNARGPPSVSPTTTNNMSHIIIVRERRGPRETAPRPSRLYSS